MFKHAGFALFTLATLTACGGGDFGKSSPSELGSSSGFLDRLTVADKYLYVRLPRTGLTPEFAATTGFNPDHIKDEQFVFGYIDRLSWNSLSRDVSSNIALLDAKEWAHFRHDPQTLERIEDLQDSRGGSLDETGREGYHNYNALTTELRNLADQHPSLLTVYSAGQSVQGRELWYVRISATAPDQDTSAAGPKLLYIANMHGDETTGREMMIYLIRQLVNEYATNPRVATLVNNAQIFIMPSMNPDGFELSQRYNKNGVDLNRDFPDFTSDPTDTPVGRADETQHIMRLHDQHHFDLAVNFHGGEVCFNLPWDTKTNKTLADRFGDDPVLSSLGREYADANPTMKARNGGSFTNGLTYGYEWYEVDGGMQDWASLYRQSVHATVELSYTKYPSSSFLATAWRENQESMLAFLERGLRGVHLRIVNEAGTPVAGASVNVSSAHRAITYSGSTLNRVTLGGDQRVTIDVPGMATTVVQLPAAGFAGAYQEVVLPSQK